MAEENKLREGVAGRFVDCRPVPEDPGIVERRHRASCLLKPKPQCGTCPNSKFTLLFNLPEKKFQQVMCPRWKHEGERHAGKQPDSYVITELASCKDMPFSFCGSCPSREELQKLEIDKTKDGWFARWTRFRKEMLNGDDTR